MKPVVNVTAYVRTRVAGRNLLYAGCSDDFGGLHKNAEVLQKVARTFIGLDNKPRIHELRPDVDVRIVDLSAPNFADSLLGLSPDVIVLTEILEHLSNPAGVLGVFRKSFPGSELLLSVPNATSFGRLAATVLFSTAHLKFDGPDHVYAFNRSCLEHLLSRVGITSITLTPYIHARWLVPLVTLRPNLGSGWIAEATL